MVHDNENQSPDKDVKDCAKLFFEMDLDNAAAHWKKLRHFATICAAIVTINGFGLADLFDYKNNLSVMLDGPSGGYFGIHIDDNTVSGITAAQIIGISRLTQNKDGTNSAHHLERDLKRRVSTTIAAQLLEMIDPYIFPDSSEIERSSSSHQHVWHTLLRSIDPLFGDTQGPLLFVLLRMVLVVIAYLEPTSSKFLKSCYLLRCFQRWCMEMISELGTVNDDRSHNQLLVLDRLLICIILQCHRTLFRCSSALKQLEAPTHKVHVPIPHDAKQTRRLYKGIEVLGDVILDIFKTKGDTLHASLSQDSYEALKISLAAKENWTKESTINSLQGSQMQYLHHFLNSHWIQSFHDNDYAKQSKSDICFAIPDLLKSSTYCVERGRKGSDKGYIIMKELSEEAISICTEFNNMLDEPFQKYLSARMKWTDATSVRDLEYYGNLSITNLSSQFKKGIKEAARSEMVRSKSAKQRYRSIQKKIEIDITKYRWKLARHPDTLHRRILLVPNRNFDNHVSASYDSGLGIEREKALMEKEQRLRLKSNSDLLKMVKVAKEGIVKRNRSLSQEIVDGAENDDINVDDMTIEPIADAKLSEKGDLITDWDRNENDEANETTYIKKKGTHDWVKEFIWASNEKFINVFEAVQIVTVNAVVEGEIVLSTHNIYFRPTNDPISVVTKEKFISKRNKDVIIDDGRWRLSRLQQVHGRRFMLRAQAIELFFADTHQLFLNFCNGSKVRDKFVEKLRQCKTPLLSSIPRSLNPRILFKNRFSTLTESWKERKISNFEYLMELNIIAGRTFNDISQYPVFPWVLADFESDKLDLNEESTFRDLSKPIGALNFDRLAQFIERYHDLDGLPDDEKFLYGSHYSSPGVVLHYLIRQEPFTSMAIDLQSGRFDCPDRLFYDIGACWKSCLQSTSDVKELVPELFTCPEVFLNTNNYPLGETQSRISISNVILPPWANGSAYEFVRLHRLALESEYVSSNLHHWIDLIFGYKQRGAEAVKANNVFHFLSYEGSVDLDKITDEIDRAATESQIQNFGQIPSQLLCTEPHPQRYPPDKCWMPIISELIPVGRLACFTPVKQFNGLTNGSHGPVLSIHILPDHVVVIYADLSVGMYKWSPTKYGKAPFYLRMDKMRPIVTKEMTISSFALGLRENVHTHDGKMRSRGVGNWSFAMTTNNTMHTKASRSVGLTKTKDVSSSTFDVTLLSCGYCDNTLKAHTLDGLRLKSSETGGHLGQINCICLGEDGTMVVTGSEDGTCRIWAVENPNMAVALIDSYVQTAQGPIQSTKSLTCCLVLWGHGSSVISLACSSALDIVISGSDSGIICVHTMRRGTFIRSINTCEFSSSKSVPNTDVAIRNLALHSDGVFVAHLQSGLLQMYTINGVKLACVDCGEKLNAMEMVPGGHSLVTGGESGRVIIRSLRNLEIQYVLDLCDYGPINCISFTPPPSQNTKSIHQFILVGTFDGSITVVCAEREEDSEDSNYGDESQDLCDSNAQLAADQAQYVQHHSTKNQVSNQGWWSRRVVSKSSFTSDSVTK
jgi:WD40 repeat protein